MKGHPKKQAPRRTLEIDDSCIRTTEKGVVKDNEKCNPNGFVGECWFVCYQMKLKDHARRWLTLHIISLWHSASLALVFFIPSSASPSVKLAWLKKVPLHQNGHLLIEDDRYHFLHWFNFDECQQQIVSLSLANNHNPLSHPSTWNYLDDVQRWSNLLKKFMTLLGLQNKTEHSCSSTSRCVSLLNRFDDVTLKMINARLLLICRERIFFFSRLSLVEEEERTSLPIGAWLSLALSLSFSPLIKRWSEI